MNSICAVAGLLGAIWLLLYTFETLEDNLLGIAMFALMVLAAVLVYAGAHADSEKRHGRGDDE